MWTCCIWCTWHGALPLSGRTLRFQLPQRRCVMIDGLWKSCSSLWLCASWLLLLLLWCRILGSLPAWLPEPAAVRAASNLFIVMSQPAESVFAQCSSMLWRCFSPYFLSSNSRFIFLSNTWRPCSWWRPRVLWRTSLISISQLVGTVSVSILTR